jgi:hypothetical protein
MKGIDDESGFVGERLPRGAHIHIAGRPLYTAFAMEAYTQTGVYF